MELNAQWAEKWMRDAAASLAENRQRLIDLDRAIGDADHGENMDRGFTSIVEKLDADGTPATPADVFKLAAMTLMSRVGGAAGPLYGTAFLRAAKVTGLAELDSSAVVALLEGALEGITARGKAAPGEKTMVDAWQPAVDAAVAAADSGADPVGVLEAALAAAEAGALATVPLLATKGRASYLGERSIGHQDPGATSTVVILRAAVAAATAPGE